MSLAYSAYRFTTRLASPLAGLVLGQRARAGKEDPLRLNERFARRLPVRLPGPLVWLHGASVGETQMLLELGRRLLATRSDLMLLFTSQTLTSARLVAPRLPDRAIHMMAPLDTPGAAQRFIDHWQPDLCVFGEGELWPNLLHAAEKTGAKRALVNARMTAQSATGWMRWREMFQHMLDRFDVILAADADTSQRLEALLSRPIEIAGNLKAALPPPDVDAGDVLRLKTDFVRGQRCLLAASTHDGEETLFLDAVVADKDTVLIIAPRHPERGEVIANLLRSRGISFARRSSRDAPNASTHVLLADTMGEMGLWFRLCDAVYLGGGHAPDIGGHNPLEPLRFHTPVVTGPDVFNFAALMHDLVVRGLVSIVADAPGLRGALAAASPPTASEIDALFQDADLPMNRTLAVLLPLLPPVKPRERRSSGRAGSTLPRATPRRCCANC